MKNKNKGAVLVFSAHSDDFVIGAGGTIAQYTRLGWKVHIVIFSYGEKSHPWLKRGVIKKLRAKEAFAAAKILHCTIQFLDLHEFSFWEDYKRKDVKELLLKLIVRQKPGKLFTHSQEDPHPDHHAVYRITEDIYQALPAIQRPEVYTYSIWNPVSFKTNFPVMYSRVTSTFKIKLRALRSFPSQRFHIIYPLILLWYKAIKDGLKLRTLFGEHFFRIR